MCTNARCDWLREAIGKETREPSSDEMPKSARRSLQVVRKQNDEEDDLRHKLSELRESKNPAIL